MAVVHVPSLLQDLTGGVETVEVQVSGEGRTSVRQVVEELDRRFPGLAARLLGEDDLMPGIAVFIDGEQNRLGLRAKIAGDSQIFFIPPVVGG